MTPISRLFAAFAVSSVAVSGIPFLYFTVRNLVNNVVIFLAQDCVINLDGTKADYPPLVAQNGKILYPNGVNSNGQRIINVGKPCL